jgi:hypothetical protein
VLCEQVPLLARPAHVDFARLRGGVILVPKLLKQLVGLLIIGFVQSVRVMRHADVCQVSVRDDGD